jgi:hypothetical protein
MLYTINMHSILIYLYTIHRGEAERASVEAGEVLQNKADAMEKVSVCMGGMCVYVGCVCLCMCECMCVCIYVCVCALWCVLFALWSRYFQPQPPYPV